MARCPAGAIQLLKRLKVKLIEILSADADFVLQHADSRSLLSPSGYEEVKCCRVSSEKVRDLVDHIIQRGPETAQGLLDLLKEKDLQETFPMLDFLTALQDNTVSSGEETSRKRKSQPCLEETIPSKKLCNKDFKTVKEKQLMKVARAIGRSWREIGRLALEIPSVKLEQIEEDHSIHAERVFAMLNYWRNQQREKATAALLHSLLSQDEWALPAETYTEDHSSTLTSLTHIEGNKTDLRTAFWTYMQGRSSTFDDLSEGERGQIQRLDMDMANVSSSTDGPIMKTIGLNDLNRPLIDHSEGQLFLNEALTIIMEEVLSKGTDIKHKVCEWKEPEELAQILDLQVRETGEPHQRLLERVRDVAKYSVKTSHPHFINQQFGGVDYYSLVGRFLTETLNTNLFTYEVAPVFVLMENEVLKGLRQLVGWTVGDGLFCPGGSASNMYAMNLARYQLFPEVKNQGLWCLPKLAIFTSHESHYSVKKGAAFLGIGIDNVVLVEVDDGGRMIPEDLDEKIQLAKSQGAVPLIVSCTSGTTVQGAFDPLHRIADVCEKHQVWMHVDGAWGGSVLFSIHHKHLMKGVDRANSVAWNPHKMLVAGLQCSVLLLKDTTNLLKRCHSANATYLFQQDKFYDMNLDIGDKSLQCSRKVDCLKLWLMWKAVGSNGLAERVDKAFYHTRYLVEQMRKRDGFQLLKEPEFVNVCFWFIPPSLREKEQTADYWDKLAKVAPVIKERMVKEGTMMVGYQPLRDKVNFFRIVVFSPLLSHEDMDFFLNEIERLGNDM